MGNYQITIEGVGVHGNRGLREDAEEFAARLVRDMREVGHTITHATVHAGGGKFEIAPDASRSDGREPLPMRTREARAEELQREHAALFGGPAWSDLGDDDRATWAELALRALTL